MAAIEYERLAVYFLFVSAVCSALAAALRPGLTALYRYAQGVAFFIVAGILLSLAALQFGVWGAQRCLCFLHHRCSPCPVSFLLAPHSPSLLRPRLQHEVPGQMVDEYPDMTCAGKP